MKIKYLLEDPDIDKTMSLVEELKSNQIITDSSNQIVLIDDDEIILSGIMPSESLTNLMVGYEGFEIQYDPTELEAFEPENGVSDLSKVGSVQSPTYEEQDDFNSLDIELFNEQELNKELNSFNNQMKRKRNFNEPALDENGVAVDKKEPAVEAEQAKDSAEYDPAAGSLSSFDVTPFTEEEVEQANNVDVELDGNKETKVFNEDECPYDGMEQAAKEAVNGVETFTDEEISEMDVPEEVDAATEDLEEQVDAFSARKKKLYSAKLKLRRLNNKAKKLKTFAEELTEGETEEVIEDIIAILEDAPEIKEEVMKAVGESEEMQDEAVDTEVRDEEGNDTATEETEEFLGEDVTSFTEEEIESAEEDSELESDKEDEDEDEDDEDEDEDDQETDETEAGEIFCKSFSSNEVLEYRRNFLANMQKNPNRKF